MQGLIKLLFGLDQAGAIGFSVGGHAQVIGSWWDRLATESSAWAECQCLWVR